MLEQNCVTLYSIALLEYEIGEFHFLIDTFVSSVFYFAHGSCSLQLTIKSVHSEQYGYLLSREF